MRHLLLLFFLLSLSYCYGQKYLQIDKINDPKTIKIPMNSQLIYKVSGDDEWREAIIKDIMIEDSILLIENGFIHINSITHIQRKRNPALYISALLQGFGTAWSVFAVISSLSGGRDNGNSLLVNLGFGALNIGVGWLVKKLFYKRVIEIGRRYNLRLLDLSLN